MSSRLLIDESPLLVIPGLAKAVGLNEAIVLQQVHYWLNPKFNKTFLHQKHWVWKTYQRWAEEFSFWSIKTVRRVIESLENQKLLLTFKKTHNMKPIKYYSIDYDRLNELLEANPKKNEVCKDEENCGSHRDGQSDHIDLPIWANGDGQPDHLEVVNMGTSYIRNRKTTDNKITPPLTPPLENSEKKEEEETKSQKILTNSMLSLWNKTVQKKLNKLEVRMTSERSQSLLNTLQTFFDNDLAKWKSYCDTIADCKFLMGKNISGFRVTLDWAARPENVIKILEGAIYDKPSEDKETPLTQSDVENAIKDLSAPIFWKETLQRLLKEIGPAAFQSWIQPLQFVEVERGTVTLRAPSEFFKGWIESNYRSSLERALDPRGPIQTINLILERKPS